jgi:Peptidase family M50
VQTIFLTMVLVPLGMYLSAAFHEFGHWLFAKLTGGALRDLRIGGGQRIFGGKSGKARWGVGSHPFGGLAVIQWPSAGKNHMLRARRDFWMSLGGPVASVVQCIAMALLSVPAEIVPALCIVLGINLWMMYIGLRKPKLGEFNDRVAIVNAARAVVHHGEKARQVLGKASFLA